MGLPEGEQRLHRVDFAVKFSLLRLFPEALVGISESLCFYHQRICTYTKCRGPWERPFLQCSWCCLIIHLGYWNARDKKDHIAWNNVIGKHGIKNVNSNGLHHCTLCSAQNLIIPDEKQTHNNMETPTLTPSARLHNCQAILQRWSTINKSQGSPLQEAKHQNSWKSQDHQFIASEPSRKTQWRFPNCRYKWHLVRHQHWFADNASDLHTLIETKTSVLKLCKKQPNMPLKCLLYSSPSYDMTEYT